MRSADVTRFCVIIDLRFKMGSPARPLARSLLLRRNLLICRRNDAVPNIVVRRGATRNTRPRELHWFCRLSPDGGGGGENHECGPRTNNHRWRRLLQCILHGAVATMATDVANLTPYSTKRSILRRLLNAVTWTGWSIDVYLR